MKTYRIQKYLITGLLFVAGLFCISSCDDFLTITPTDRMVEEEFWEDRNDLEGALAACYVRLINGDLMAKYIQWGEIRGDNFELKIGSNNTTYTNLMNANLQPTSSLFDWTQFYNCINYCNKVMSHGPDIVERDESFSMGDWRPIRAEAMTIRSWCLFNLVRTFGEIPYARIDYNNDSQNMLLKQSSQIEVLDSIIMDLEEVKDLAMVNYGNTAENKGRITRNAVYALLADVYLWRACYKTGNPDVIEDRCSAEDDYNSCIVCCDYVINSLLNEYKETLKKNGNMMSGSLDDYTWEDLLVPNVSEGTTPGISTSSGGAYDAIFGRGNSRESIWELQFDGTYNVNGMLSQFFWDAKNNVATQFVCSNNILGNIDPHPNSAIPSNVFTKTDYRRWETTKYKKEDQTEYPLAKYNFRSMTQYNGSTTSGMRNNNGNDYNTTAINNSTLRTTENNANWIIYRLSDVLLMKAEAMVNRGDDEHDLWESFWLVRGIFKRSNPYAYQNATSADDSLNYKMHNTKEGMNALILNERQREFVGEGKRWFDLVRFAQREGNTVQMLKYLTRKFTDNKKAIEAKLAPMKSLFSPIYINELRSNKLLHQNDVWSTSESTSKTDEL